MNSYLLVMMTDLSLFSWWWSNHRRQFEAFLSPDWLLVTTSAMSWGRTSFPVELCLVGIISILIIKHIGFTDHPFRSKGPDILETMLGFDTTNNHANFWIPLKRQLKRQTGLCNEPDRL
jgi:hypothetical protein